MPEALLGATVSLLIFVASQWFLSVRGRSDFLRTRLEDFFLSLETVVGNSRVVKPMPGLTSQQQAAQISEDAGLLIESLQRPLMYARLYFRDFLPRTVSLIEAAGILNEYMHGIANGKKQLDVKEAKRLSKDVRDAVDVLRDYALDYYEEHIRTPRMEISNKIERL